MRFWGPKNIAVHVERFLRGSADRLRGRTVVDIPAGDGRSSRVLQDLGARVQPLDLFPEFFEVARLTCRRADLGATLPVADHEADVVLCQEGIEHVPDQLRSLREFNRVLKRGGTLLVTTPNASSLRSRFSHLVAEAERFYSYMPPNEVDSVWRSPGGRQEIYLGHVFLIGVQRLRLLAHLAGFRIRRIHPTRATHTSALLLVVLYPLIVLTNLAAYAKAVATARKRHPGREEESRRVYREQLRLNLDPTVLLDHHLFVELEKVDEAEPRTAKRAEGP